MCCGVELGQFPFVLCHIQSGLAISHNDPHFPPLHKQLKHSRHFPMGADPHALRYGSALDPRLSGSAG